MKENIARMREHESPEDCELRRDRRDEYNRYDVRLDYQWRDRL